MPYFADAVRILMRRAAAGADVVFTTPAMPIMIESSPALFADLIQGFFAEAGEQVAAGRSVSVAPFVVDGQLEVEILGHPHVEGAEASTGGERDPRASAAADARRFVVETLARASGGSASFDREDGRLIGRLAIPLRVSFD